MTQYIETTVENFPYLLFDLTEPQSKAKKKNKKTYKNIISAFDIETTNLPDIKQAYMYTWQMAFYFVEQDIVYYLMDRTWESFKDFLNRLKEKLDKKGQSLVVYVHNLSFEFQFLKGIFKIENDDIFALKSRKVLKVTIAGVFEFRCSYLHSNISLSVFLDKFGAKHQKKSGEIYDYNKIRTPSTPLTDYEKEYIFNDVIGLVESLYIEMLNDGDNLYTIPLTSTGYVRRDVKKALEKEPFYKLNKTLPNYEVYQILRLAFRGGNTHANRFFTGQIIDNVYSYDRKSSYPEVQENFLFPMGKWIRANCSDLSDIETYVQKGYACLFIVQFTDIQIADYYCPVPYLTSDKAIISESVVKDNGRVLKAKKAAWALTDIDFEIVKSMYIWDNAHIEKLYISKYGKLPQSMLDEVTQYFKLKTELDGVQGKEIYYMKSKNKLNSIYGMTATMPIHPDIIFKDGEFYQEFTTEEEEKEEIERYNKFNRLSYAWGVWTTAHARRELQYGIDLAGYNFVYADTDSVKTRKPLDFSSYNEEKIRLAIQNKTVAYTPAGQPQYLGVYEQEKTADKFRTWGAKKYVCEFAGKLKVTVAGVVKTKAAEELEEAGGIEAFKTDFIFKKAGGTQSVYNDNVDFYTEVNGEKIHITDNVAILEDIYTLGISSDYDILLKGLVKKCSANKNA